MRLGSVSFKPGSIQKKLNEINELARHLRLQIRLARFDSGSRLQTPQLPISAQAQEDDCCGRRPDGEIGRRSGLKIRRP